MKEFVIKQGSTLPYLVMELNLKNFFLYETFYKALETAQIEFSMFDDKTGTYRITKKEGGIILKEKCEDCFNKPDEYFIYFKFTENQTLKVGRYRGEFKIIFTEDKLNGIFMGPVHDTLYINITKSLFNEYSNHN